MNNSNNVGKIDEDLKVDGESRLRMDGTPWKRARPRSEQKVSSIVHMI